MKTLKILDWPEQRFYSETHPFYRWKNELKENGLNVKCYHNHLHKDLKEADYLIIHSRYFDKGKNVNNGARQDEEQLISYLSKMRQTTEKLIWFDAADSSGSADFSLISYVDVFLKKQVLKDRSYYTGQNSNSDLRIWLNTPEIKQPVCAFHPCPADQLSKIRIGWNLALNDYRYFGYKLSRLSNYVSYDLYPPKFSKVTDRRGFDVTFRGSIPKDINGYVKVFEQRKSLMKTFSDLTMNIATGAAVSKKRYWMELRNSKISISPYGWGEICYRDFESFISGALLIKPSMEHLDTYPNIFIPYETYIPVAWNLNDLEVKLENVRAKYADYKQIALNGQELYKRTIYDAESFIRTLLAAIA
jgi:hypothetical protein